MAAAYATLRPRPRADAMLPISTIVAWVSARRGSKASTRTNGACRLIASNWPTAAGARVKSSSSRDTPAATSSAPAGGMPSSAARTRAPGSGSRPRSSASARTATSKRRCRSCATASRSRGSDATSSNGHFARASCSASARPRPLDAPITIAVSCVTGRASARVPTYAGRRDCARRGVRVRHRSRGSRDAACRRRGSNP